MNKKIKYLLQQIPNWITNRYFISVVVFLIWMSFFDTNSFLRQLQKKSQIYDMQNDIKYYTKEIKKDQEMIELLSQDSLTPELEKLFREELFLSRNNEEIFIIK